MMFLYSSPHHCTSSVEIGQPMCFVNTSTINFCVWIKWNRLLN
jgi:hypothetical protein